MAIVTELDKHADVNSALILNWSVVPFAGSLHPHELYGKFAGKPATCSLLIKGCVVK